jgi:hypothetical protein
MIDVALIQRLLPELWQDAVAGPQGPTAALLAVMTGMLAPIEERIANLDIALDPHRCGDTMLPFLARMNGFDALLPYCLSGGTLGASGLRALLVAAPELRRLRGRPAALRHALGLLVDGPVEIDEGPLGGGDFHVVIRLPAAARSLAGPLDALVRLLRPAHVTHALDFGALSPEDAARPSPPAPVETFFR